MLKARMIASAGSVMADRDQVSAATLLDQFAMLNPRERQEVAIIVRRLSETFADVRDGKTTSHALGLFAHMLDPA